MKKVCCKLLLLLFLAAFFVSCSDDDYGPAVITIDPSSNADPYSDSFFLKGTVKSESGSTIELLTIIALYKAREYENEWSSEYTVVNKTEILANIHSTDVVRKIHDNEYEFYIDKQNSTLLALITTMYGIRINTKVKDGDRATITWDIVPEYNFTKE